MRNVRIEIPDLSCGGKSYPDTRSAFIGGFKRAYIETWNGQLDAKRSGVLIGKSPAQKRRRDYLSSHFIKWTKDAEEAMYNYEIKTTQITGGKSPHALGPADRDEYWRASCIQSAFNKGGTKGMARAQDGVREVLDRAPPDA